MVIWNPCRCWYPHNNDITSGNGSAGIARRPPNNCSAGQLQSRAEASARRCAIGVAPLEVNIQVSTRCAQCTRCPVVAKLAGLSSTLVKCRQAVEPAVFVNKDTKVICQVN